MTRHTIQNGASTIDLILEDCLIGIDNLAPETVDVVVTSPPYNIGVRYGVYDDTIDRASYLEWLAEWSVKVNRVLSGGGSLFLNIGGKPTDPWIPMEVATRLGNVFQLQNTIHWIKSISVTADDTPEGLKDRDLTIGHIKPINSRRYLSDAHEYIFHFTKTGAVELDRLAIGVPYKDKSNVTRWKSAGKDLRCRGNTWFIPYETIMSREKDRPHPATFPPRLAEMCIKVHGLNRVNVVMDPFLGLGNTAVACLDLGVSFVGFEIDPEYFQYACRRVSGKTSGKGVEDEPPSADGPQQMRLAGLV